MDLIEKTAATIAKHSMLAGGETVLIALSGGPDSVCLSVVLSRLSRRFRLKLHALYVDHGLRPEETPEETAFCEGFCQDLHIPFRPLSIEVKAYAKEEGKNLQEAARELRYRALDEEARRVHAGVIALGHTLDDQAETFLMRLLRGSGPFGLAGIPPVRANIVRPLVECQKEEILAFLEKEKVRFVVDSSNFKDDYLRNRVRTSLIPLLREMNPNISRTLGQTAEIFREEERYFQAEVTRALMKLITRKTDAVIELFLVPLEGMAKPILRRVLRRALEETRGLRGIGFVHLEDIIRLVKGGKAGDRVSLPKGIRAIRKYSTLLITSNPPLRLGTYRLEQEGEIILPEAETVLTASFRDEAPGEVPQKTAAVFDAGKVSFPLTVRAREEGDFFYPLGFGKRKKLHDFFIDEKVPRDERESVPVVTTGGDILWVAGMRGDERFRPGRDTTRFLVLQARPLRR
jgi:tRNA(Ile)-lysidine synthase